VVRLSAACSSSVVPLEMAHSHHQGIVLGHYLSTRRAQQAAAAEAAADLESGGGGLMYKPPAPAPQLKPSLVTPVLLL